MDTGIAQQNSIYHPDLPSSRVVDQHGFNYLALDDDIAEDKCGHGTHVSGTIGGSGSLNNMYRGLAPDTDFLIYRLFKWNGSDCVYQNNQFDNIVDRAAKHEANILSNSWGGGNGNYNTNSEIADKAVRGEFTDSSSNPQYMNVIISAGNDNDLVSAPGTAKNAITVGAAKDGNYPWVLNWGTCTDDDWPQGETVCFTNFGPIDIDNDGNSRVKPDVIAPGVRIKSTVPWYLGSGNYYDTKDGTSMAAPVVSGAVATLLEAYPTVVDWPELVKARVINTAIDVGNPVSRQGHGMIDTYHMIYSDNVFKNLLWVGSYLDGTVTNRTYTFNVPSDFEEVRVTLTGSDPAGSAELTNDLDFYVYDGADNYKGSSNTLDDNVEDRTFTDGTSGQWKVVVDGITLNDVPQTFGLAASAILSYPNLSLSGSSNKTVVNPNEVFNVTTVLENDGYTAAGSYLSIDLPNGISLNSVNIYRADNAKFNYSSSDVYRVGSTYYIAVGELIRGYPRKVEWILKADSSISAGSYIFTLRGSARNVAQNPTMNINVYYDTTNPTTPTLTSPSGTIGTTTPTFRWNDSTDDLSGIKEYQIQIDDNLGFGSPEINTTTTSEYYTAPSGVLSNGVTYYWRVRAVDKAGNFGGYTDRWSFTIDIKPDLTLQSSDISFSPSSPSDGDNVLISADISNTGGLSASNVKVRFSHDGTQIGSDYNIASIGAGGSASAWVTWNNVPQGTHTIEVTVDPGNAIAEANEGNNVSQYLNVDKVME